MERRRYPRIAVNLNVALLDDRLMPRGCRVRDVSQGGMLLQFEQQGAGVPYDSGQSIQVRASLKDGDDRRVLLLPATVRRVEEKGIGVEFARPEAELIQLLAPYRLDNDKPEPLPAMVAEPGRTVAGADIRPFSAGRPRHRHTLPNDRARLAERIATAREAIASSGHLSSQSERPENTAALGGTDRRILQLGLASLAVAMVVVIFNLAAGSSNRQRLAALESAAQRQAEALADVQIRLTADRDRERLARLDNRVSELAVSVAALETGKLIPAPEGHPEQKTDPAPIGRSKPQEPASAQAKQAADKQAEPVTSSAPAPTTPTGDGPWVINLVSLYDKAAAERFSRHARELGIEAAPQEARVQDRPVWRLQVGGFASRDDALAYSEANKTKLGLKKVWIFKR